MRFYHLCSFLLLFCTGVRAQIGGCPGRLVIDSDADVIRFNIDYPSCARLLGDLTITGAAVTDLSGLSDLISIGGNLLIEDLTVSGIEGLEGLTSVTGDFTIRNCRNLRGNGFPEGLAISQIGGFLQLENLPRLTEFIPLNDLNILSSGFGGITLAISNLDALSGLSGNMASLSLVDNPNLTDLAGINGIALIDVMAITGNPQLDDCAIAPVCAALTAGNPATISGNATGCSSLAYVSSACAGDCHPDYPFLVEFYEEMNGPNWVFKEGWEEGAAGNDCDVCNWTGIQCSTDGRVIRIGFSSNNLAGEFPACLRGISTLQELELENDPGIYGSISSTFSVLPVLSKLKLNGCSLTGNTPRAIDNWPALEIFNVANNEMGGDLRSSLANVSTLRELVLFGNNFTGCYPRAFEALCDINTDFRGNAGLPDFGSSAFFTQQFCANNVTCDPNCHPDFIALEALYEATDGDNWTNRANWLVDCDVCNWFGVTCDANDRVRRLELPDNNLVGPLPPEIANLTEVEYLRFNNNAFAGGVPDLTGLTKLLRLRLHRAGFSGTLPTLGAMPGLTHLSLYDNAFTGIIPNAWRVGNLPALQFIYLDRNQISGPLPSRFADLPNLEEFNAHTNNFVGCYPPAYADFCNLNSILFYNNDGLPDNGSSAFFADEFCNDGLVCANDNCHPDFEALIEFYFAAGGQTWDDNTGWARGSTGGSCDPCGWVGVDCNPDGRVESIQLFGNNLTGTIAPQLGDVAFLKFLDLRSNGLTGQFPASLWNLPLISVNVSRNQLGGQVPGAGPMPFLEFVSFSQNEVFGSLPIMTEALNLRTADFSRCAFTDIPDTYNATEMPNLERLTLNDNEILALLPSAFGEMTALNFLNLRNNQFQGCYPDNYRDHLCAGTAVFSGNDLLPDEGSVAFWEDEFCVQGFGCELACHPDIDALLSFYNATDGPNWTDNSGWSAGAAGTDCLPCNWLGVSCDGDGRVTSLTIQNNNLSGTISTTIGDLDRLSNFNLYNNSGMTGPIPTELLAIASMTSIILADNNHTGGLPANLTDATGLINFQVDNNTNLGGALPASMAALSALRFFTAGNCDLTGGLPADLGSLDVLETLHLGNNNLSGSIPLTVGSLSSIRELDLQNNELTGSVVSSLGNASTLEVLRLNGNNLNGVNASLANLTALRILDLNDNNIGGDVPTEWRNFENLTEFNIGNNAFTGRLLRLGDAGDLLRYVANGNRFSNQIPAFLFSPSADPVELFLNDNMLTGDLPYSSIWESLTTIQLSNNQLEGCYPQGYQNYCGDFTDFSGNADLPDGGSTDFFENTFCVTGKECDADCPDDLTVESDQDMSDFTTRYPNCTTLTGHLKVKNEPGLTNTDGLSVLTSVGKNLTLDNVDAGMLQSIENVLTVGGSFRLEDSPDLTIPSGAQPLALTTVDDFFEVDNVGGLTSLNCFSNLITVGRYLELVDLNITDLTGLESLVGTLGGLVLKRNPSLANLSVIAGLMFSERLDISDNVSLSECAVNSVCQAVADSEVTTIVSGNAVSCASVEEVEMSCSLLPVTWRSFTARVEGKRVALNWATGSETDNASFRVERSTNGADWSEIGAVLPNENQEYGYYDEQPLSGESLYRLRQVDYGNDFSFSEVRLVNFSADVGLAWPNPFTNTFTLFSANADVITVHDLSGRRVRTIIHTGGGARVQRMEGKQGVYLLRFQNSGRVVRLVAR